MSPAGPPRLLLVGHAWPEPAASAAGQRTLRLLRLFAGGGSEVHFACAAAPGEHRADLGEVCAATHEVRLNCSSFDALVAELAPEVVLFDRFMTEEQFGWRVERSAPGALRILDTVDLHCLRRARRQAHAAGRVMTRDDLLGPLAWRELAAIWRSDLALLLSGAEVDLLTGDLGVAPARLHHLPFLLDPPGEAPGFSPRAGFVTIGTYRHPPNWDALRWLKAELWPAIRARLPGAELRAYGAYQHAAATGLDDPATGFRVKGWAPEVGAVMRSARVCLAPLRFGAGLKGKLAEAMLAGTPSVTTAVGAEGMGTPEEWPGAITEDPEAFAEAAVQLHEDEAAWGAAAARAAPLLRARFDGARRGAEFLARVAAAREGLAASRAANLVGAMLRHHRQRGTEFMGRWIEAKEALRREG